MNARGTIDDATRQPRTLRAALWCFPGCALFRFSPRTAYSFRRRLLNWFGADLATTVKLRNTCRIDRPWNLTAGALTVFGDDTIIRSTSRILIGERCVISQYSLLMTTLIERADNGRFRHHTRPIEIGNDCWIATDCLALPGAAIPDGVVVGARSVIEGSLEPWTIATGAPAKSRRKRPPFANFVGGVSTADSSTTSDGGSCDG